MTDSDKLIEIAKSLGEVKGSVDGVRGEVRGVRKDLRSLNDKVDRMPDQWRTDSHDIVESKLRQRDEVAEAREQGESTGVANLARERERARREGRYSTPPTLKRDSWVSGAIKEGLKPFITFLVTATLLFGVAMAATKCGNVEKADLKETQHQIEQLKIELKKVNGHEKQEKE